jgi:hypothetical protein
LSIEGRLAAVNYRLGEPTEAYDWHVADVGARVLGPEHPAVRGAQQRLAATPVQEELTPPQDPPPWQRSYAGSGYVGLDLPDPSEEGGGWAPGYAAPGYATPGYATPGYATPDYATPGHAASGQGYAAYVPSPTDPGVYHLQPMPGGPMPRSGVYGEAEQQPPLEIFEGPRTRGHAGGIALVAAFGLAVLAAAVVIAYQVFAPASPAPVRADPTQPTVTASPTPPTVSPSSVSPTPAGPSPYVGAGLPPGQLTMKDDGYSVTLSWLDPSAGQVPFLVTGGRVGEQSEPLVSVPPGMTTKTLYGLNPHYNYCYTVAAVWSSDFIQPSAQICTKRASAATGA